MSLWAFFASPSSWKLFFLFPFSPLAFSPFLSCFPLTGPVGTSTRLAGPPSSDSSANSLTKIYIWKRFWQFQHQIIQVSFSRYNIPGTFISVEISQWLKKNLSLFILCLSVFSFFLSILLCISLISFMYLSIDLSIYISIDLSIYLSIDLSIYLSISLSLSIYIYKYYMGAKREDRRPYVWPNWIQ